MIVHRHLIILFALLLGQTLFFIGELQAAGNLTRNSSRECAICHFRWIDQFIEGRGTALAEYEVEDVAGDELMCFSCHDGSTEDSRSKVWLLDMHKTGVKPSDKVKIPKLFPLSHEGEMMCATCHSAHSNPTDTSIERSIFLRITNNDSIMCEMCHVAQLERVENHPIHQGKNPLPDRIFAEGAVPSFTDVKHVICESCHTPHGGVDRNLVYTMSESALCAICHPDKIDDTEAPASEQVNHSLFVAFKQDPSLEFTLQAGENGTLQCLSCHKMHQHAPGTKSLLARRKILCTYCHADKDMQLTAAPKTANHPVEVIFKPVPAGEFVPAGGENNTVQCYSCHAIHQHAPGTKGLPASREILCATCHADQVLVEGTDHDLRITKPEDINILEQNVEQFGVCVSCHIPHKATGRYLWSRPAGEEILTPSALCLVCHGEEGPAAKKGVGEYSHPVAVEIKDSSQLPLYKHENGRLTMECHSCHDPHRWQPGLRIKGQGMNAEGDGSSSFLRQPVGTSAALCSSCHAEHYRVDGTDHDLRVTAQEETNIAAQSIAQAGICSSCHIPHNGTGPMLWAKPLGEERTSHSYLCLSCHTKKGPGAAKMLGKYSHRVGVAVSGTPQLPLVKKDEITSVMECGTCHNPHSWIPGGENKGSGINIEGDGASSFLRITNQKQPELCIECHGQQGNVAGTDHDMRIIAPDSKNLQGQDPSKGTVCSPCHSVHNAVSQAALWNSELSTSAKDFMARACYGCHRQEGIGKDKLVSVGSHPERYYFGYNKPYSIEQHYIPQSATYMYPLFDSEGRRTPAGEITCPTCHDPHIWHPDKIEPGPGINIEGTPVDSFLRKDVRKGLCYACHGIKTLFLYRYYHVDEERRTMMGPYSPSTRK
ncbi:MAG: cytochrome c3 family protein [Desulfobulbaceae bacterium]|nr:cytochrome c3 family protein [Desulfobulbaceae bacterium]